MPQTLTEKIIFAHLDGKAATAGQEIELKIDQTLTQDATGTMAYLQWEAIGLSCVQTELSVSYVDHNTLQMGFRNPDDHRYLQSVAARYGLVFSPPGTGICHQLHLENFAKPGKTLIGSDSHTPTAGGLGALAIGAGGLSVAMAMAGEPYKMTMPQIFRIWLTGELKGFAGAKDVILYLLKILSVKGGVGAIMEYDGPGVASLSVLERATISNMGAELGATTSIFPSDEQTRRFLATMGREEDFLPLTADEGAKYDREIVINLCELEPLVACPHMPDKVVPVRELDGLKVNQIAIGSCTNSSYSDLKAVAELVRGKRIAKDCEMFLSPGSKQVMKMLMDENLLAPFLDFGGRLLESSCGPCIGMGGSPCSGGVSVRTFNRNFEGRSGTLDAQVYLVSPLTAAMCALHGKFTDPATWGKFPIKADLPEKAPSIRNLFHFPAKESVRLQVEVLRGPNIVPLSSFDPLPQLLKLPVLLKVADNITTDHIMPAGAEITALRSNIPAISRYVFSRVDNEFVGRCDKAGSGIIVAGENYGQGSSREHAALAPRHLGIRVVLARSFARIHRSNLINFGILPLIIDEKNYTALQLSDIVEIDTSLLIAGRDIEISCQTGIFTAGNDLSSYELKVILAGGLLNTVRKNK